MNLTIPESPIKLDGFPLCTDYDCPHEVGTKGQKCGLHGGPPAVIDIIHRTIHRQIRTSLRAMVGCDDCHYLSLDEIRCIRCCWYRGAIMGMAGIAEQLGWGEEMIPYLNLIAHRREHRGNHGSF